MTAYVYRCFDASDRLLYVGFTLSPPRRLKQHQDKSVWFHLVSRTAIEEFDTRDAALAAERRAIYSENPICNIHCNASVDASLLSKLHDLRHAPRPSLHGLIPDFLADAIQRIEASRARQAALKNSEKAVFAEAQAQGFTASGLRRVLAAKAACAGALSDDQLFRIYRGQ